MVAKHPGDLPRSRNGAAARTTGTWTWGFHVCFELVGEIRDIETFAIGGSIREFRRVAKAHGRGRWRKRKGVGMVRLADGVVVPAELHWYEAHGIGRREMKIKRRLDPRP